MIRIGGAFVDDDFGLAELEHGADGDARDSTLAVVKDKALVGAAAGVAS